MATARPGNDARLAREIRRQGQASIGQLLTCWPLNNKSTWGTNGRCTHGAILPLGSGADKSPMTFELRDYAEKNIKAQVPHLEMIEVDKS